MSTRLNFEADDNRVEDVLFSNYKYRVPRYQRPYAWEDDQISEFWADLVSTDEPYFIGSLIFNYEPYENEGWIDIIDGQQRLLTITIFTAVLRDLAETLDEKTAALFHEKDIVHKDREGNESVRILPGESIQDFFKALIQNRGGGILEATIRTKEEERVKRCYAYLHQRVSADIARLSDREDKLRYLRKVRDRVSKLIVIDIHIENEEEAYEIFETTNARGVDLSVADLLKNLIFKKIRAKPDRDFAKEVWQEITSNVQATDTEMKRFIRYFWISRYAFVSEKRLFREFKRQILDWTTLLQELWDGSGCYNRLLEGNEEDFQDLDHGDRIYRSLSAIRFMNVSQCFVLFLSILRNIGKIHTDPVGIFELVEKFTFQYSAVCKLPGNTVEKIYSKYATRLEITVSEADPKNPKRTSGEVQRIFADLRKELQRERPSWDVFREEFAELSYRNSQKGRQLTKYVLGSINDHYAGTDEQRIDFNNVNVEHILPQKPSKESKLAKKVIKGYVNKLGNLTLLSKRLNSRAQNKLPKDKMEYFTKSQLPITRQLVETLNQSGFTWGEAEISARQEALAKLAYDEIWTF